MVEQRTENPRVTGSIPVLGTEDLRYCMVSKVFLVYNVMGGGHMKNFSENEWGLVLAGGGGKGAYQIGVFRALAEKKIDDYITAVSGSSVGALNLALFAMKDLNVAESVWKNISPDKFLDIEPDLIDMKEGFASREGLLEIIEDYVNLDAVSTSDMSLYVTATEYDENGVGDGKARYFSLNYKGKDEIRDILLASSALPTIYEPVRIDGKLYRDGGLKDNLPIAPLYAEGIRHFIVVGLSTGTRINYDRFPDAEFVFIKPKYSIGEFVDGTLDFTAKGARKRMEIGYIDAIRELEFSDKDLSDENNIILYQAAVDRDYKKLSYEFRKEELEQEVNSNMDKLNVIIKKYS